MTPLDTLRPPPRSEADGALTSPQIDELVGRVRRQPTARAREGAREEAIRRLAPLARRIAGTYRNLGGEEQDDLVQVACLGLVKAVDGYDPEHGHAFLSYAVPTITGELKRHLRDRTTLVRLPRSVQEARQRVRRARQELEQAHGGRPPTPAEIAEACGLSPSAVAEAVRSQGAAQPLSLDASPPGAVRPLPAFGDVMGGRDPGIEAVTDRVELIRAMRQFPERERRILVLRFFHDQTQQQIAAAVGVSQMHVSRLLARCLARLREVLGHLDRSGPAGRPGSSRRAAARAGQAPAGGGRSADGAHGPD
uniref:sigma-70 family RNA polymerase sigma factor n=1 Tax=Streptomyces hygroscopicus TaxID=1912 RepID=UPI0007854593